MSADLVSKGEALRRAIAWLAEHPGWTLERIEEACQRFDLSPLEEDFLIREFRRLRSEPSA